MVHGALVSAAFHASTLLQVVYVAVGIIGIAAYAYRELLARFFIPAHAYTVSDVRRPNEATAEVSLDPVREPLAFVPGQFVVLSFGGVDGWERHPFSVASAPSERRLEVSVKAAGDYTRDLVGRLKPGTPAKAVGPFGGFDYRRGGPNQVWIAGGIGITPFMSWIRSLDGDFDRRVDFWYSVRRESDALYLDEIRAAGGKHPTLHPMVVETERDGLLTAERAAHRLSAGQRPLGLHVRSAGHDDRAGQRLPRARDPGQPSPLGAVRHPLRPAQVGPIAHPRTSVEGPGRSRACS